MDPIPGDDGKDNYWMNIDGGNQAARSIDVIVNFIDSKNCKGGDCRYELKTLSNIGNLFTVSIDAQEIF